MTIFDTRPAPASRPNVDLVTNVDIVGVRDYIHSTLARAG
jgi:hypothetical protein